METKDTSKRNFNLTSYVNAQNRMIATNDDSYSSPYIAGGARVARIRDYTKDEIARIIESGSLAEQKTLSRNYFYKDGYYKQIIIHYATLLKYAGLLIPNPTHGNPLSTPHIQKRYFSAVDYLERMDLKNFYVNCAQKALVDGCYYGVITEMSKEIFSVLDLPTKYCRSQFKDVSGNDIIEFDITYFNTISNTESRKAALSVYPKVISKAYRDYKSGDRKNKWVVIPSEIGVCFPMFDSRPLLLSVVLKTIEYDDAVEQGRLQDAEEIKKIIIQKLPHLADGRLVFEPDEAAEMHDGAVRMLHNNPNVSVLTTYADVDSIVSKSSNESEDSVLNRIEQNIYSQAGVSSQVFNASGSSALQSSLDNDLALMMYLAEKFARFTTNIINSLYANANIVFKYTILPISYYNTDKYIDQSFKLASSGYSLLIPALALGLSQKDLGNLKDLENDVLGLVDKLKPLSSSYTQSGEGGNPGKEDKEKADQTIKNETSLDNNSLGVLTK